MNLKNQVQLIGNVGNQPETVTFENGGSKTTLSIATNRTFKKSDGEKVTQTQWHTTVFFGKISETVEKFVNKGDLVAVQGELTYRSYEDKEGNKRSVTEVVCDDIQFLSSKKTT